MATTIRTRSLVLALTLVAGCAGLSATEARSPVSFAGGSATRSDQQRLSGDYGVAWALPEAHQNCIHQSYLTSSDGSTELLTNEVVLADGARTGRTNVIGLKAGSYYVDATVSTCGAWTMTLTPK